jgi:hypothetical protein
MNFENKEYKCCEQASNDNELEMNLNQLVCPPECRPDNHQDWIYC